MINKEISLSNIQKLNVSKYERLPELFSIKEEQERLKSLNVLLTTVALAHQNAKVAKYQKLVFELFEKEESKDIIKNLFWLVLLNLHCNWSSKKRLCQEMHQRISGSYSKIFIQTTFKERDFVLDALTLLYGIQVYMLFTGIFKTDLKTFSSRFLIDCIHFTM